MTTPRVFAFCTDSSSEIAEAVRRAQDDGAIHPRLAGAEHAAQPRGAELERPRETLAKLRFHFVVRAREDLCELGARLGAGVVGHETFGALAQVHLALLITVHCLLVSPARCCDT